MIANIPEATKAKYEAESDALSAAFWAVKHAAGITRKEWAAWERVKAAELHVARPAGPLPGHRRKLLKLFGSADLRYLGSVHGNHPAVRAAREAAHKAAGITQKDLAGYARVQHVDQGDEPAPTPHGNTLAALFGASSFAGARRAFNAHWEAYFGDLYATA